MRSLPLLFLVSRSLACVAHAPPPAPVATPPAPVATPPAPVAPPPAPSWFASAHPRFETEWSRDGAPGLRVAVLGEVPDTPEAQGFAWEVTRGARPPGAPLAFRHGYHARGLDLVDVTGDGVAEAVVWVDPASRPADRPRVGTLVYSFDAAQGQAVELVWTSLALGDVTDLAALRTALPNVHRFLMPEASGSPEATMLRVGYATPAEFRSLLSPCGVTMCSSRGGNARPHGSRCVVRAVASYDDVALADLRASISLFHGNADSATGLEDYAGCRTTRDRVACDVPTGGPAVVTVTFTGPTGALRISRIEFIVYELT